MPKVVRTAEFFCDFYVKSSSCTFWRPHLQKVRKTTISFLRLSEIELALQSRAHFVDLIFKKWSDPVSFSYDFYLKSSSHYSLVHILPTSSAKSGPNRTCQFFTIFMLNRALTTVSRTFCRTHLQKVVRTEPVSFLRFLC